MQVAVTNVVAEHVGPVIDAFTARDPGLEVAIETVAGAETAELLEHRRADIVLGPAPAPERAATIASVPFLRCRLIVVAAPDHALAGRREIAATELAAHRWLIGPPELDPSTGTGLLFARAGIDPGEIVTYNNHAAAVAAAVAGDGLVLTLAHTALDRGPSSRAGADRRPRHTDPRVVARLDARLRPRAARRARDAAVCHQSGGHAANLDGTHRRQLVTRASSTARDAVELGGGRRWR